ncbi:MAG: hypothetical protein Kow0077_15240 [Anaerolineae bacterium]
MSVTEEIKARLDLVAYISESVSLKKAGRNYKANCPFHQERTPSFVVFPDTQTWRCFGACATGGDIFAFAMKQNGWEFREALEHLAQRAGVDLAPRTPEQTRQEAAIERQLGLLQETANFYHDLLLNSPQATAARDYVTQRGLTAETVETFRLGYAPDGWQHTLNHLQALGYTTDEIVAAGVAIRNERGRVYDRFRHRLIIPIRDGRGRVIGFGARALRDEDNPKYLNSPQTELFDKSQTLFGLDLARREIRESETAIIVEGYMDVMQAHQAGFHNVVAQMGTALTTAQLQVLRKYADRLILALDADQAGVNATMRGLDVARQSMSDNPTALFGRDGSMRQAGRLGLDMRVIVITSGKDPDDLIRENPEEWQRLTENAEPVADYVIRVGTAGLDAVRATVQEKEKIARQLLPLLTATESDLQKEVNVQKLAYRLHLPEKRLMEIAIESRTALARRQRLDPNRRHYRPTPAMENAARTFKRPAPPPRTGETSPPPEAPRRTDLLPPPEEDHADFVPPVEDANPVNIAPPAEGPRPQATGAPPPPDDDMSSQISSRTAPTARRFATAQTTSREGYLLAVLLRRPEAVYQANRELRQLAEAAPNRFPDASRMARLRQALSPLQIDDFQDSAYRAIFQALQEALNQFDLEPQEYVEQTVGSIFREQLDALRTLVDPASWQLGNIHPRELRSIEKEMRKQGRILQSPEQELVDKVFELRRERLLQVVELLRFVVAESEGEEAARYQDEIDANKAAIFLLDQALRQRKHLLHE